MRCTLHILAAVWGERVCVCVHAVSPVCTTVCACMCVVFNSLIPFRGGGREAVAQAVKEIKHSERSEMVLLRHTPTAPKSNPYLLPSSPLKPRHNLLEYSSVGNLLSCSVFTGDLNPLLFMFSALRLTSMRNDNRFVRVHVCVC